MGKTPFRIITSGNLQDLAKQVNNAISEWYALYWQVFLWKEDEYCIVLVEKSMTDLKISEISEVKDIKRCSSVNSWSVEISWTITANVNE